MSFKTYLISNDCFKKITLQQDAGIAFIQACPTTLVWTAITGPRHQAVEEILPSNSIWLFGKLNRQLPWWLWSCLWVCHRVRLLMECLDSHFLFISPSFSYTIFGIQRPTLFHKANTALLKPNGFLHKFCCTSVKHPFPFATSFTTV